MTARKEFHYKGYNVKPLFTRKWGVYRTRSASTEFGARPGSTFPDQRIGRNFNTAEDAMLYIDLDLDDMAYYQEKKKRGEW